MLPETPRKTEDLPLRSSEPTCEICHSRAIKPKFEKQNYQFFSCPNCYHLQIFPIPSEDTLEAEYEHGFGASNRAEDDNAILKFAKTSPLELPHKIFSENGADKDSFILDIGCSFGYDLYQFRKQFGCENIYGVDLSSDARRIAQRVLRVPVFRDVDSLLLQKIQFDFVYLKHNLEHHRHPQEVLDQIHDILKPGGKVLIGVPNRFSLNGLWGKRWEWVTPPIHIHYFSKKSLERVINDSQLKTRHFYSRRGHGMPLLKHALYFSPGIGQQTRKFLGDPYNANESPMPHIRSIVEKWFSNIAGATASLSSPIKSKLLIGEELWVLAEKQK